MKGTIAPRSKKKPQKRLNKETKLSDGQISGLGNNEHFSFANKNETLVSVFAHEHVSHVCIPPRHMGEPATFSCESTQSSIAPAVSFSSITGRS